MLLVVSVLWGAISQLDLLGRGAEYFQPSLRYEDGNFTQPPCFVSDPNTQLAMCKEVGYSAAQARPDSFGEGRNFECSGVETALRECRISAPTGCQLQQLDCAQPALLKVMLVSPNSVQMLPSNTNTGLLAVYSEGFAGTVCDDGIGTDELNALCRMLGFVEGAVGLTENIEGVWTSNQNTLNARSIWVDNLVCDPGSSDINFGCTFSRAQHDCSHSEDLLLSCRGQSINSNWVTKQVIFDLQINLPAELQRELVHLGVMDFLRNNMGSSIQNIALIHFQLLTIDSLTTRYSCDFVVRELDGLFFDAIPILSGQLASTISEQLLRIFGVQVDSLSDLRVISAVRGGEFQDFGSDDDDNLDDAANAIAGIIIGCVVGGIVCCCAVIGGVICCAMSNKPQGAAMQIGQPAVAQVRAIQMTPMTTTAGDDEAVAKPSYAFSVQPAITTTNNNYTSGSASVQPSAPILQPAPSHTSFIESELQRIQDESSEFTRERLATSWLQTVPRQLTKEQGVRLTKMFTMSMCQKPVIIGLQQALINPSELDEVIDQVVDSDFQRGILRSELKR